MSSRVGGGEGGGAGGLLQRGMMLCALDAVAAVECKECTLLYCVA